MDRVVMGYIVAFVVVVVVLVVVVVFVVGYILNYNKMKSHLPFSSYYNLIIGRPIMFSYHERYLP